MSGHRDLEIWAWSVSADARWPALAGYSQRVQYKLAVTVHRCLRHRAPRYLADYCVPVSEVTGPHHLRYARCHQLSVSRVRRSTFGTRAFSVAGIYSLIICGIQLLTPNKLGKTKRHICLLDIWSISALQVLHYRALQINVYLPTYLLLKVSVVIRSFQL